MSPRKQYLGTQFDKLEVALLCAETAAAIEALANAAKRREGQAKSKPDISAPLELAQVLEQFSGAKDLGNSIEPSARSLVLLNQVFVKSRLIPEPKKEEVEIQNNILEVVKHLRSLQTLSAKRRSDLMAFCLSLASTLNAQVSEPVLLAGARRV